MSSWPNAIQAKYAVEVSIVMYGDILTFRLCDARLCPAFARYVDPTTPRIGSLANSAAASHRDETAKDGKLMVSDVSELISMDYAFQQTLDIYSARQAQHSWMQEA